MIVTGSLNSLYLLLSDSLQGTAGPSMYHHNNSKTFLMLQGADFIDIKSPRTDENGHGTHVAGTVMALEYGMAPKATSVAVRVLNAEGSGSTSGIMDGISWVVRQGKRGVIK